LVDCVESKISLVALLTEGLGSSFLTSFKPRRTSAWYVLKDRLPVTWRIKEVQPNHAFLADTWAFVGDNIQEGVCARERA